jgi:hypothetical protein
LSTPSTRVNLAIPLEAAILIEKECDKRGIKTPQFIKESIFEKLRRIENKDEQSELTHMKEEINEIKKLTIIMLDLLTKK